MENNNETILSVPTATETVEMFDPALTEEDIMMHTPGYKMEKVYDAEIGQTIVTFTKDNTKILELMKVGNTIKEAEQIAHKVTASENLDPAAVMLMTQKFIRRKQGTQYTLTYVNLTMKV